MLIQFSVRNFKTFKEETTINLMASKYDQVTREDENVIVNNKFNYRVLKSSVTYGANASGKSKFIDALAFMKNFVVNSSKNGQKGDNIRVEPFRLSTETENEPSEFEIIFLANDVQYRYGFEVNSEEVVGEWLFVKEKVKEVELFYRDFQSFDFHSRRFGKGKTLVKQDLVRNNALMLSVAAQFNDELSEKVISWFKEFGIISGLREEGYEGFTISKTRDKEFKSKILNLLKAADLGIQDLKLELIDLDKLPSDMPKEVKEFIMKESEESDSAEFLSDVLTTHKKYDKNLSVVETINFSMEEDESYGTKKFFALTGPVLDSLENGTPLIVDELDSKLHPNLVCKIVSLFNSIEHNPKNAQLIFNTHDTNLLSSGLFRRDQIWFTEKNKFGEAKLFSLADFKSDEVRKGEAFEDNYIRGKYGAIPFLGFFDEIIPSK